jgi:hypothetical protein
VNLKYRISVRRPTWIRARCGRRELYIGSKIDEPIIHFEETLGGKRVALVSSSYGENRGSSPLGSANPVFALCLLKTFSSICQREHSR